MKKLVCLTLVLIFALFAVACGNNSVDDISSVALQVETSSTESNTSDAENTTSFKPITSGTPISPSSVYAPNNVVSVELFSPIIDFDNIKTYEVQEPAIIEDIEFEKFESIVIDNIDAEDASKLASLSQDELDAIATKKESFQYDLIVALKNAGISANFNDKNGEIGLDSSVLFGGDSAELSTEGKAFLNDFIKAYASVVSKAEYKDFISKVMVEGHTAPVAGSTYESGLPLSQQRADNVKNYCISKNSGLSDSEISTMTNVLVAKGMSNSEPIKDASGNVNMSASRRVTFKFIINI